MSPEQRAQRLLRTSNAATHEGLLAQADAETLALLLDRAKSLLAGDAKEALRVAELARELAERRGDETALVNAQQTQGRALRALGRHAAAIITLAEAAEQAEAQGDARLAGSIQLGTVDSLAVIGRIDEAIALAGQWAARFEAMGAESDLARVLVNLGTIHYRRDDYAPALACLERALSLLEGAGDLLSLARTRANLANVYTQVNRSEEALTQFQAARDAFMGLGWTHLAAMTEANIGFLRYVSGEHHTALQLLAHARAEFITRGMEWEQAKCDADMADVYRELRLFPEALECYERAIVVFAKISLEYERARAEWGRAAVLSAMGRPSEALAALGTADTLFLRQKNPLQRAFVALQRAQTLIAESYWEEGERVAKSALRRLDKAGLEGWAGEARLTLAECALHRGETPVRALKHIAQIGQTHRRRWLQCRAERLLGEIYLERNQFGKALPVLRAAVATLEEARALLPSEEMHTAFLGDKLGAYESLVRALLQRGRPHDMEEALEIVGRAKSRLLLERMETAAGQDALTSLPEQQERLHQLRSELSRAYYQLHEFESETPQRRVGAAGADLADLEVLERAYRAALHEAELMGGEEAHREPSLAEAASITGLQSALAQDETFVEYYILGERVCAFVVTRTSLQVFPRIADVETVRYLARRLRFQLQRQETLASLAASNSSQNLAGVQSVLNALYALLWEPMECAIQTECVVLAPYGGLHALPLHALFDGTHYLADRHEVVYAPSAAIWRRAVERQKEGTPSYTSSTALLMGVPSAGIEQVKTEIEEMARLLPTAQVLLGEQATLEAFVREAEGRRWVHIATHALFRADNPLFSGLRFAEGWLMARDLYGMRLNCELATLSACRTGSVYVEPGDELFGLTRGFLAAGVRALAVSLWAADDAATASLMVAFYARLARGESKATALRRASLETREKFPHPYYWAAFALIGER